MNRVILIVAREALFPVFALRVPRKRIGSRVGTREPVRRPRDDRVASTFRPATGDHVCGEAWSRGRTSRSRTEPPLRLVGEPQRLGGVCAVLKIQPDVLGYDLEQIDSQAHLLRADLPDWPRMEKLALAPHLDPGTGAGPQGHFHVLTSPRRGGIGARGSCWPKRRQRPMHHNGLQRFAATDLGGGPASRNRRRAADVEVPAARALLCQATRVCCSPRARR